MNQEVGSTSSQNLLDNNRPTVVKQSFKDLYTQRFNDVLSEWEDLSEKECANYLIPILKVNFHIFLFSSFLCMKRSADRIAFILLNSAIRLWYYAYIFLKYRFYRRVKNSNQNTQKIISYFIIFRMRMISVVYTQKNRMNIL